VTAGNLSDGPSQVNGEVLGTGAPLPDRRGSINLDEAFVELQAPLVLNKPFARAINLEAGYRDTSFGTAAGEKRYGSLEVRPGLDAYQGPALPRHGAARHPRAEHQRAVRPRGDRPVQPRRRPAPGGPGSTPPTPTPPARWSDLCRQTGVPAAQVGAVPAPSAGQISNTGGGNPNLGPRKRTPPPWASSRSRPSRPACPSRWITTRS
jgi:hypothetical protein